MSIDIYMFMIINYYMLKIIENNHFYTTINSSRWVTLRYQDQLFDIHLTKNQTIDEIRPIDSEVNIAPMLCEKTIQNLQEKIFMKERIMQYKDLRQINVSQHIEKKNGLSYLSWSWALDQLLQLDDSATWEYLEPKRFGDSKIGRAHV